MLPQASFLQKPLPELVLWSKSFPSLMVKLKPSYLCPAGQETALVPIPCSFHSRTPACLQLCKSFQERELAATCASRTPWWQPVMTDQWCKAIGRAVRWTRDRANRARETQLSLNWGCNLTWSSSLKKNATRLEGWKTLQGMNVNTV